MRNTPSSSFRRGLNPVYLSLPLLLTLILFSLVSCTFNYSPRGPKSLPDAPRSSPLNDWLYRGSQPLAGDFATFKAKGIRTVINFRDEEKWIDWERKQVEGLGMKYVSLPWNIMGSVDPKLLDRFFEVLDNPANRPALFHCKHGRDRSGVMAALALMRYEKMSEAEARELALETIRPHLRYQLFVNQKIKFFLNQRPAAFSDSSGDG